MFFTELKNFKYFSSYDSQKIVEVSQYICIGGALFKALLTKIQNGPSPTVFKLAL